MKQIFKSGKTDKTFKLKIPRVQGIIEATSQTIAINFSLQPNQPSQTKGTYRGCFLWYGQTWGRC